MPSTVADAILGTTFFGPEAPVGFGRFDSALITMFCVAAGMGWPAVRAYARWAACTQLRVPAAAIGKAVRNLYRSKRNRRLSEGRGRGRPAWGRAGERRCRGGDSMGKGYVVVVVVGGGGGAGKKEGERSDGREEGILGFCFDAYGN